MRVSGMQWFRRHIKHGSRLALLALVVQLALSFGHFHAIAAQAEAETPTALAQVDLAGINSLAVGGLNESAQKQSPANPDTDQQPTDLCAICATIAFAGSTLLATPPALILPQALERLYLTADTGFTHLKPADPAFQSRAPPNS